jgi:hypothetical protein
VDELGFGEARRTCWREVGVGSRRSSVKAASRGRGRSRAQPVPTRELPTSMGAIGIWWCRAGPGREAGELQGGGRPAAGERERGAWPEKRSGGPAGRWATKMAMRRSACVTREWGRRGDGVAGRGGCDAEERVGGD